MEDKTDILLDRSSPRGPKASMACLRCRSLKQKCPPMAEGESVCARCRDAGAPCAMGEDRRRRTDLSGPRRNQLSRLYKTVQQPDSDVQTFEGTSDIVNSMESGNEHGGETDIPVHFPPSDHDNDLRVEPSTNGEHVIGNENIDIDIQIDPALSGASIPVEEEGSGTSGRERDGQSIELQPQHLVGTAPTIPPRLTPVERVHFK
ncbi:hypothetical protein BT69DRAFT_794570 [Atractiella rhizophila]|nr:hypothetical protein BT69DRAFT_794570 [Atractiella rhizophila]